MITDCEVHNFRGLESLRLDHLARINLIVGDSSSGKTSLIEALFLAAANNPQLPLQYKFWRASDQPNMGASNDIAEAIFGDIFFEQDLDRKIEISLKGTDRHTRSLTITADPDRQSLLQIHGPQFTHIATGIKFVWVDDNGEAHESIPTYFSGTLQVTLKPSQIRGALWVPGTTSNTTTAEQFSQLSLDGAVDALVKEIKKEFNFLEGLQIIQRSGVASLYAKVEGHDKMQPVSHVSGGFFKTLAILLQLASLKGGVFFVDEIEDGIYYRRHPSLWRSILSSCKANGCQIFASTHSLECLRAAAGVAETDPSEFSLIRMSNDHGLVTAKGFSGEEFFEAVGANFEIR